MGTRAKKDRRQMKATVPYVEPKSNSPEFGYITASYHRSGILPPPAELERYELLFPGITERLLMSYEKQSSHRMTLEKKVIDGDSERSSRGQIFAFIITTIVLVGGFILLFLGKNVTGLVAIISALAALTGTFITGSVVRSNERKAKSK